MNPKEHFDNLLPPGREWFTTGEMARLVGRSPQHIRDCLDDQTLCAHLTRAKPKTNGREKRRSIRVSRDGVLLYLLETANYDPEHFEARLGALLRRRPPAQRERIIKSMS